MNKATRVFNIVELTSELSLHQLLKEMDEDEAIIFNPDGNLSRYTEKGHKRFNELYDEYYDILKEFSVPIEFKELKEKKSSIRKRFNK